MKIDHAKLQLAESTPDNRSQLAKSHDELVQNHNLHKKKAEQFYIRKRDAKSRAKDCNTFAAIAFDFQKNLPTPNKTTNDVYYRRQLSTLSFNIHVLGSDDVYMYCYNETVARKGADDVVSMLDHFFKHHLPNETVELELFCDGCAGQNKNFTVIRYFHHLVHTAKRFRYMKLSFPIRGHSYMECDRDMSIVDCKTNVDLPSGWEMVFKNARTKPTPFNVVSMDKTMFFGFSNFLKPGYRATCPMKTRPIRELLIHHSEDRKTVQHRSSWNGVYESSVIAKPQQPRFAQHPKQLYSEVLPIKRAKYDDLQVLKRFCSVENQQFYDMLVHSDQAVDEEESE
jgi:hypothetical protein